MSRWVYIKLLGSIAAMLILSLACAIILTSFVPFDDPRPNHLATQRVPASQISGFFEHRSDLNAAEIHSKTGLEQVVRGREVIFHSELLNMGSRMGERTLEFGVFSDVQLTLHLQPSSAYGVNNGILVGLVHGDPSSRVRLQIEGEKLDGRIETEGREYRILYAGEGRHWIIEVRSR